MTEVLNESNLSRIFIERFLNKHYPVLNSIADILVYEHHNQPFGWLKKIYSKGKINQTLTDPSTETMNMRALRNAWYHECSLNYPPEYNNRMKFPAWKIIQCYYSVFSSIAALVRCYDKEKKGHDSLLNCYGTLLRTHQLRRFFIIPLCIHLKQNGEVGDSYDELLEWEYGKENHLPVIIEGLKRIRKENKSVIVTIPHYLKSLRDWATYEDSYIFFRFYGEKTLKNLDSYLRTICEVYNLQTEVVMVKLYGFDVINRQKEVFAENLTKHMGIKPNELVNRFEIHKVLSSN